MRLAWPSVSPARAASLLLALLLAGCARQAAPPSATPLPEPPVSLEQRLEDLSARTGRIADAPLNLEEAQAHLKILEEEKAGLLARLTGEHPSVLLLERQIRRLRDRIAAAQPPEAGSSQATTAPAAPAP